MAVAAVAYLLLPLLYATHVSLAHGGRLDEAVAVHFVPKSPVSPPAGEHPNHAGHCDLCRLLASVSSGGEPVAGVAALPFAAPATVGLACADVERPYLGRCLPVALLPRAPPLV